jgi:hypothetical protein
MSLSGCASRLQTFDSVILSESIHYRLQPIPKILTHTGIQALFKVQKKNSEEKSFLIHLEMNESHLLISAMTLEGFSLFSLDWNILLGTLNHDNKTGINPLRVLAELQLVLWPLKSVLQGLNQGILTNSITNERFIHADKTLIYHIKQHDTLYSLYHHQQDYSIKIKELERWKLNTASQKNRNSIIK